MSSISGASVTPLESSVDKPYTQWVSTLTTTPIGLYRPTITGVDELDLDSTYTPAVTSASISLPDEVTKPVSTGDTAEPYTTQLVGSNAYFKDKLEKSSLGIRRRYYGKGSQAISDQFRSRSVASLVKHTAEGPEVLSPAPEEPARKNIRGSHLAEDLDPVKLSERIDLTARALTGYDFDTIAFRGVSGTILAAPLAIKMSKEMVLVRKDHDTSHSFYGVEGYKDVKRYIIVDDFISSGHTAREIVEKIQEWVPEAVCLGLIETRYVTEEKIERANRREVLYSLRTDFMEPNKER